MNSNQATPIREMSQADSPSKSPALRPPSAEGLLIQFDRAWQSGTPPRLDDFLSPASDPARRQLLEELIKIDLECRWCRSAQRSNDPANRPLHLEDYIAH